jgi:UPF0755 protein
MYETGSRRAWLYAVAGALGLLLAFAALLLSPTGGHSETVLFAIESGDGFREVASRLKENGLIRSATAFKLFSLTTGSALRFKPGVYSLAPVMSTPAIAAVLTEGVSREVEVLIPEGASLYLIDKILAEAGVLAKGELVNYSRTLSYPIEGRLFPDTYRLYRESEPDEVADRLLANFENKAGRFLDRESRTSQLDLILASLIEKEVPDSQERKLVSGILKKRLAAGMPLQVDASICYVKQIRAGEHVPCEPIFASDLRIASPYNTYLELGLPPGPIGSPGLDAIAAALDPLVSPYWYYISDPKTGRTIFARTLDEHNENRARYLTGR